MSRYIDAEWLKAEFPHNEDWDYPVNTNSYVVEMIDEAPHIDIVRCKECKYERDGEEFMWCEHPNGLDSIVKPDDYCSYGERKEGE